MRSLTFKLTMAFLLIGVIGAALVAVLVGQRTREEFGRFRDQTAVREALAGYYASAGSWVGVESALDGLDSTDGDGVSFTDASGTLILERSQPARARTLPADVLRFGTPILVQGQTVGYLLDGPPPPADDSSGPPRGGNGFIERVTLAALISAVIAGVLALLIGNLLARQLTRPLRDLTAATRAMAEGELVQQVSVRSRDEVGQLALAFNQMSSDLARASQLRKQMTADLAHDLRTPLSILRGYTEGLQDGRLQGSPAIYELMYGEVEHLQRLVEDLRVLSLADAGELTLNKRQIDPAAVLERTGLAYVVQAEERGIALRVETPTTLPSVLVDTDRMTQVLNNLVSNAMRHTRTGEIVLSASSEPAHVVMQVRDTGSGIDADDLPFIFDRFYRADKSRQRTDSAASSGLGLAIVRAIVEAHGGSISAQSAVDSGTTFTIRLPAV